MAKKETYLTCSDGNVFEGMTSIRAIINANNEGFNNRKIEKVLLSDATIEEKFNKLIQKANNRGGTDNISVAYLVREEEGDDK